MVTGLVFMHTMVPSPMPTRLPPNLHLFVFVSVFWATSGGAEGFLLALHPGIAHGGAQGTIWNAGGRTQVKPACKAPYFIISYSEMLCMLLMNNSS